MEGLFIGLLLIIGAGIGVAGAVVLLILLADLDKDD